MIVAVADGCGWGYNSRDAAIQASNAAVARLKAVNDYTDLRGIAQELLHALAAADRQIRFGKETLWESGTCTLVVGVLIPSSIPGKRNFVCASVGDCKVFCFNASQGTFTDITFGNREISADPSDPGGRLGPFKEDGSSDLRNWGIFSHLIEEDDILFCVSDGVHDNLDPEELGILPNELGIPAECWSDFPAKLMSQVKARFSSRILQMILLENQISSLTPRFIVNELIQHAKDVTTASRAHSESESNTKLPSDYRKYPGKVDHTTCVAFVASASFQGHLKRFEETQRLASALRSEFQQQTSLLQFEVERHKFESNMPLQVSIGLSPTHIKVFCRTIATGQIVVRIREDNLFIRVEQVNSLRELIPKELESLMLIGNDEFSFPIERSIALPRPVNADPTSSDVSYDDATGLVCISLELKDAPTTSLMSKIKLNTKSHTSASPILSGTRKSAFEGRKTH